MDSITHRLGCFNNYFYMPARSRAYVCMLQVRKIGIFVDKVCVCWSRWSDSQRFLFVLSSNALNEIESRPHAVHSREYISACPFLTSWFIYLFLVRFALIELNEMSLRSRLLCGFFFCFYLSLSNRFIYRNLLEIVVSNVCFHGFHCQWHRQHHCHICAAIQYIYIYIHFQLDFILSNILFMTIRLCFDGAHT